MTLHDFLDYADDLNEDCFPLIVTLKDDGKEVTDIFYYNKGLDLYLFLSDESAGYQQHYTEVLCWVSAKEAIERFYDDSYSDS